MATNPFFNTEYYLQNNRDVFVSGMNAETHYAQYGAAEALEGAAGRKPAPWFDIVFYFENNPDLINAGLTAPELFQHFTTYGYKEGRAPNAAAEQNVNADSLLAYALANPDLLEAFGIEADATELTDAQFADLSFQYFAYGYNEDRPALPSDQVTDVDAPGPTLTVGKDYIEVEGDNNVISAPVEQNLLGAVTNTLETGDVILGAEGSTGNKLEADLAISISGTQTVAPAISATTKNIDVVELRAQTGNDDWANSAQGNDSHIDAEKFEGVKEWWSTNSRATIQIEDVRTAPEDTTIGLKNSDPFVGFNVYFDPSKLSGGIDLSNSNLTLTLVDNQNPGSLADVPVDGFTFTLGGESYTLQSDAMGAATNYAEFEEALQAALAETEGLEGVTAKLNADNTITLNDPAGQTFTAGSWKFINDEVPAAGTVSWNQVVGAPQEDDKLISTNVVLDNVGRTSQGGSVDIGSLGDGGVEEFNVQVGRDSWVTSLKSSNFLGSTYPNPTVEQFLEVVNVAHLDGANGDLVIGNATVSTDDRVTNGLTDVRELNAQGFSGDITAGINLTEASIGRYLEPAELEGDETVDFNYTTGSGSDNLTINVANALTQDGDFALNVDLGASDDRLNLSLNGGNANNVSVDGGEGKNTIELSSSQGTNAGNTFKDFANFQDYVVAGSAIALTEINAPLGVINTGVNTGHTEHVFGVDSGVTGVESVVVATGAPKQPVFDSTTGAFLYNTTTAVPGGDTTLVNLEADTSVTISGKNQTLGQNNSNDNQTFGNINIGNAAAATLKVDLANSARNGTVDSSGNPITGHLKVAGLNIDQPYTVGSKTITPTLADSTTRTLDLVSSGKRATTNEVTDINAQFVNTFNISGTQDLTTTINTAANIVASAANNAKVGNFVVDASGLTANIDLTVDTAIINRVAATNHTNTLTGAEDVGDVLTLDGVTIATLEATTISGFETINFDLSGAGGTFNALKTTGVDQYNILAAGTGAAGTDTLTLSNLADKANVNVFTADVYETGTASVLTLGGEGSEINVKLSNAAVVDVASSWSESTAANQNVLNVNGYKTVNLDLNNTSTVGGVVGNKQEYEFALTFDDGTNPVAARELVLTGGRANTKNFADAINPSNSDSDTVTLNNLDNALRTIDISDYAGHVTGAMKTTTTTDNVSNVKVVVGAWNMDWNVMDAGQTFANTTYNTTFKFTEGSNFDGNHSTWTIENFIQGGAGKDANASQNNFTVLDVSDLGISSYTDLHVTYDNTVGSEHTSIVSKEENLTDPTGNSYTWEIKLAGAVDLSTGGLGIAENFKFAV